MRRLPSASPTCFWLRKAAGRDKYKSAVADAIDSVEKAIAWCERDGEEEWKREYRIVTTVKDKPDAMVRSVFSNELIRGEEGFGNEARPDPCATYEVWPWLPMMSDHPAVGRGGGTRNMEVRREA
jgi:hypothetical protein